MKTILLILSLTASFTASAFSTGHEQTVACFAINKDVPQVIADGEFSFTGLRVTNDITTAQYKVYIEDFVALPKTLAYRRVLKEVYVTPFLSPTPSGSDIYTADDLLVEISLNNGTPVGGFVTGLIENSSVRHPLVPSTIYCGQ